MNKYSLHDVNDDRIRCPFRMANSSLVDATYNKDKEFDSCVGVNCAAWQWVDKDSESGFTVIAGRRIELADALNYSEVDAVANKVMADIDEYYRIICPNSKCTANLHNGCDADDGCNEFIGEGWIIEYMEKHSLNIANRFGFCGMVPCNK